ncbi:MAG: SPOR domain-containing protein [Rhodospirillales bacterium]|nr:SPOR domain-containing protein [Rhodospirillales bacterium]
MAHYDELDDPYYNRGPMHKRRAIRDRGPVLTAAIFAVLLVVLVSVLWYSYPREAEKQELMAVPVIHADATPVRAVPQDPGGMDVPYRDSTVFEALRSSQNNNDSARIENLLAESESEQPVDREELFAGLKTELKVDKDNNVSLTIETPKKAPKAVEPEPAVNEAHETAALPMPATSPVKTAAMSSSEAAKAAKIEPAAGDATRPVTGSGTHMVQLGSLRSDDAARAEWKKLQAQFPGQLSSLDLRVQKADLGGRGVFYRVQGGTVSEAQARSICAAMEAKRPGGCLVVKR